jgi:ubiquinone/menaquinone biosynthesis C-methylase UbiE
LACGGGEISFGLSRYAGHITGFDKSNGMLKNALARPVPNITFKKQDLNESPVTTEKKVDFVTIGRAIPYLKSSVLMKTLSLSMKPRGLVIICGAGLSSETAWLESYQKLRRQFRDSKKYYDFHGIQKMQSIGFSFLGHIGDSGKTSFSINEIINHALSYNTQTKTILENMGSFTDALGNLLAPFKGIDGKYDGTEVSWANVFQNQQ